MAEAEAIALHGPVRFGALIQDVNLPDRDGRDLCARLREAGLSVPVLMLTGFSLRLLPKPRNQCVAEVHDFARPCNCQVSQSLA